MESQKRYQQWYAAGKYELEGYDCRAEYRAALERRDYQLFGQEKQDKPAKTIDKKQIFMVSKAQNGYADV
jgi:hypothetical protein